MRCRSAPSLGVESTHDSTLPLRAKAIAARMLRVGVLFALGIVILGVVLTFVQHPGYLSFSGGLGELTQPGARFPHSAREVVEGLGDGRGEAVVMGGLFLLLIMPVLRVTADLVAFAYQRDRTFVTITAVILLFLLVSFALGKASG